MTDAHDTSNIWKDVDGDSRSEVLKFLRLSESQAMRGRDATEVLLQSIALRLSLKGRPN